MFKKAYSYAGYFGLIAGLGFLAAASAQAAQSNDDDAGGNIVRFHDADEQGIGGFEVKPPSSIPKLHDGNLRVHTQMRLLVSPDGDVVPASHEDVLRNSAHLHNHGVTPDVNPTGNPNQNTPESIDCVYGLVPQTSGCDPRYTNTYYSGGAGAIAVVDAYDDPTSANDLATFSSYFGLPQANFWYVYAGTTPPYTNGKRPPSGVSNGWNIEEGLDTEWAHAMAPRATIFLVEAQDDSINSLLYAIAAAEYLVANNGGGEVSMSWGESEFQSELQFDYYFSPSFAPSNVTFLAAAGDTDNVVSYPASSPYVIGVGGTTLNRNSNGTFAFESAWADTGGGVSALESRPSYQNISTVTRFTGSRRGVPDIALDANPNTGLAVYINGRWGTVGGTSVATPMAAGILNVANAGRTYPSSTTELQRLYSLSGSSLMRDITNGSCGRDGSFVGYDLCTGLGALFTYSGK